MMWQRKLQGLPTSFRLFWENGNFTEFKALYSIVYFKSDENETMLLG